MTEAADGGGRDAFSDYMATGFDTIKGWPGNKQSVIFNAVFRELFSRFGEQGGICEIGVHHGKFLIALHNIFGDRRSLGIDVFDQQTLNVDKSGKGDMALCKENLLRYAQNPHLVTLLPADSLALGTDDIREIVADFGKFAIFSIDGGHTKLHVSIDLDNASRMTSDKGIIIIDDIFHPDWPEVTEGVFNSVLGNRTPFVPFLLTRKKLYLCHASVQHEYAKYCETKSPGRPVKAVTFASWRIPSINLGPEY